MANEHDNNWITDESFGYEAPTEVVGGSEGNWLTDKAIDTVKGFANLGTSAIDLGVMGLSAVASNRIRQSYEDQGLDPDSAPRVDINADLRNYGYSPTGMNQWFNSRYSKSRQAAEEEIENAEGFTGKVKAYLTNPDVLVGRGFENFANLLGLAGVSRLAAKAALKEGTAMGLSGEQLGKYIQRRATAASAAGEGSLSAAGVSQAIGEGNLENGKGYTDNQLYALGAGAAVGAFSPLSNMEARIGAKGVLNNLINREAISTGEPVSLLKTIGGKAWSLGKDIIKEGAVEEGGQNVAEGVFTRLGQGKPWHEGVGEDYGEGLVVGGAMGGAMHAFAGKPKGNVEQAVNNDSSSEKPAQAIPTDKPNVPPSPEEQAQIDAASQIGNPNDQATATANPSEQATGSEPSLEAKEQELAKLKEENQNDEKATISRHGLAFNRRHGDEFRKTFGDLPEDQQSLGKAYYDAVDEIYGDKKVPGYSAKKFRSELEAAGTDEVSASLKEEGLALVSSNDMNSPKYRQGELYLSLADRLKGEQPHTLLEWKQSQQAEAEKAIVQHDQAIVEQQRQEAEIQQEKESLSGTLSKKETVPTFEEAEELSKQVDPKDKARVYKGIVESHIARLEKDGKITEKDKHKIRKAYIRKEGWDGRLNSALAKLREIESPSQKKLKPESGIERAKKEAIERTAHSILESAENLPANNGYSPEQRKYFKAQHAALVSIQNSRFSASKKELNDWAEAHAVGDFEAATAIYDKYKARQMAKSYETLVKDLEDGVEGKTEFLEAISKRDWQRAINIAEDTMGLTPRDLIKSVKAKKAVISETSADGEYEIATEGSYENEPSRLLVQRKADESDLTKVGGQTITDAIRIEPYQGEIAPDVRETAKTLYEDRESLDAALSREGDKQDQSAIPLYYALLEHALKEQDEAMARKIASVIKRVQKKPAQLENEGAEKAPTLAPKEEPKKVDFSKKLESLSKARLEEMKTAEGKPAKKEAKKQVAEKKQAAESTESKETLSDLENVSDLKAFDKAEKKVRHIVQSVRDYIGGKRKKKLAANQVGLLESLNEKGYLVAEEAQALDDYKAFIAKKEGKTVRHASRSARTIRSIENHIRKGVPKTVEEAKRLVKRFISGAMGTDFVNFMLVNDNVAEKVENAVGVDVHGFAFQLRANSMDHIESRHGEGNEQVKGQIPWDITKYEDLPEILSNPDEVYAADHASSEGNPRVFFEKNFPNGDTLVLEEVLVGRGVLEVVTGWIKKNAATETHGRTSETHPAPKAGTSMPQIHRKPSISALTEKQKDQNFNDVRRGLFKSWGVAVTNQLLNSGKVVICRSNEEFLDRMVEDEYANNPSKSKEEIRQELINEGLDQGTNAIYDEKTGKVYINGENVDEGEAGAVLAHEIGVHAAKDSEFNELIKDIEGRLAVLMEKGLKSTKPSERKFWEEVKRRMDDADVSDNEERLAYFLEVYTKRNGVVPQSERSAFDQIVGALKKWLLEFLGINSLNEHQVAELLCDVVRAYADENSKGSDGPGPKGGRKLSKEIKGTLKQANGKEIANTYYVSTESGKATPDIAHFEGFKGWTKEGFNANYPAGPIRMVKGHIKFPDGGRMKHLTGTGMLHRMNNAMVDKSRMPPNYVKGDLAENVMREVTRNLSGGAQAVYAVSGNQIMVKTKGGLGVLLAWKAWEPREENGEGFWSVQTVYSKSLMAYEAKRGNEWKGALRTRGGTSGVQHVVSQTTNRNSNSTPARTAPSLIRPTDDRLSAGRRSLETFSEPREVDSTTLEEEIKQRDREITDEILNYKDDTAQEKQSKLDPKTQETLDGIKQRKASKKAKSDASQKAKEKKPHKEKTPEEKAADRKAKLAKMLPKEREAYLRGERIKKLKAEIEKAKKDAEAEKKRLETKPEIQSYDVIKDPTLAEKAIEKYLGKDTPLAKAVSKALEYVKHIKTVLGNNFLKFTTDLVVEMDELGIKAGKEWWGKVTEWQKKRETYKAEAVAIYHRFSKLSKESQAKVEDLMYRCTTSGLWAFDISSWKKADGSNLTEEDFAVSPELEAEFLDLMKKDKEAAMVLHDVFKHGYDRYLQKQDLLGRLAKQMGDEGKVILDGLVKKQKNVTPYAPLARTGRYNVTWRSNELKKERSRMEALKKERDALKDGAELELINRAIKRQSEVISKLEQDGSHYVVSRFDFLGEAIDFQTELNRREAGNEAVRLDVSSQDKRSLTSMANLNELAANMESAITSKFGAHTASALSGTLREMLLDSAQKKIDSSMRQRRNIAGANPRMMDTFMHHANTDAWLLSNLEYGKAMSDAMQKVDDDFKKMRDDPTKDDRRKTEMNDLVAELKKRYDFITGGERSTAVDEFIEGGRMLNTLFTLSLKPMFYVQNALQPLMMTAPYLTGEFGLDSTAVQMRRAYAEMKKFALTDRKKGQSLTETIQNDEKLDKNIKEMLLEMTRRNLLDLGAQSDFGEFKGGNAVMKKINKGMNWIGGAARGVEVVNRYVSAVSAYRLMEAKLKKKGKTPEEIHKAASDYAASVLHNTQGDYSALNAPSAFNTRAGKVALQFRKFQAIQMNFFLRMLKDRLPTNMDKETRKVARAQLMAALTIHFTMAGFTGLPAMSAVLLLTNALLGDDGEDDEDTIRRLLSEAGVSADVADVFLQGLPSAIGLNLSGSVGAGQMLSPVPYTKKGLSEEGGMLEFIGSAFGGAMVSKLIHIHTGWVQGRENDNMRPFLEAALPAGVPQLAKALDLMDMTTDKRTGKKFMKDEEINIWHRFLQGLGATPAPLERKYRMNNMVYRTTEEYKQETSDIKRRYIQAVKNKDYKEQAEIRKELREFNKRRVAHGFNPVKMNSLGTAVKQWREDEKRMQKYHGANVRKSQIGLARRVNDIHNDE
ncbi:PLxRFG domain-containing protein [uncultured Bacteroides sp.]|uniref:PLxRFG domain-containing protein n=1 Tax=uncultured Bacteroides sp. TaxID=162156 RepID=UPI002595F717|nr:PLxRFG domain-containing protein [uncultured Bacteroides sp.]